MKITMTELESYFYEGEEGLKKILPALKEELDTVDRYDTTMMQNPIDNVEHCKQIVYELTGVHGILVKVYHVSEGALDVMEPKAKSRLRKELTKEGSPKPTDGAVTAAAEEAVSIYRRIRWHLLGYVEGLNKTIGTLQSILKYEGSNRGIARNSNQKDQHESM